MDGRKISQYQQKILNTLSNHVMANLNNDAIEKKNSLLEYEKILKENENFNLNHLKAEVWYNELDIFVKSMIFYILAFFLLLFSFMYKPMLLR